MKRTGKFYRNNEAETMKRYGLNPTKNSGSGWIEKEDGENDILLCQLKSTDAESIKINLLDLHKLFYHCDTSHKSGVFMIQFLSTNEEYILIRPEDVQDVARGIKHNHKYKLLSKDKVEPEGLLVAPGTTKQNTPKVKTGSKAARNKFYQEREKLYGKSKH
nr:MAG TPA: hypothetical protein [Caudoviricetes sp.]